MSNHVFHDDVLNGLSPKYAEIFGEKYASLYREHVAGRRLAHDMSIEEFRKEPVIVSFGCPPGPSVGEIINQQIGVQDGSQIPIRIYYPKSFKPSDSLPCYINYHGGGWVIGDVGDDDAFNRSIVDEVGAVVVDVGYRLAPEYKFPIPVTDSWDAYVYVAEHAAELGVDPSRLAVGGFSAGGHISAEMCLLARDRQYRYPPCFQLLVIPVCDATVLDADQKLAEDCPHNSWREHYDAPFLSHARMSWFYGYFLKAKPSRSYLAQALLSPLHADSLANLPPALVVPAEVDVLRDEGIAYARRLARESGSWVQLWLAKRVPHPFPHQTDASEIAVDFRRLAIQRLSEAFNGTLKNSTSFISNVP